MMHIIKRCEHCKNSYNYQVSGDGCFNELNSQIYCPDCMIEINKVLLNIDVKFKEKFREFSVSQEDINILIYINDQYIKFQKETNNCFLETNRLIWGLDKQNIKLNYTFWPVSWCYKFQEVIDKNESPFYIGMKTDFVIVNREKEIAKIGWEWNLIENTWGNYKWKY